MKTCSTCHQVKDLDSFNKDRSRKDGHTHRCRDCDRKRGRRYDAANADMRRAKAKVYREENPDKVRAAGKRYYANNPEKESERKRKYREANQDKVRHWSHRRRAKKACTVPQRWRKDDSVSTAHCYWCGSEDVVEVDHVMPIALGGPPEPYNEVMVCRSCNGKKHHKHPLVWVASFFEL